MDAKAYFQTALNRVISPKKNVVVEKKEEKTELEFEKVEKINLGIRNQHGCNTIVLGMTDSGKSSLIARLIYDNRDIWSYGFVFTGSDDPQGDYPYMPNGCIFETLDKEIIERIRHNQKKLISQGIHKHCFIILDDVMDVNFHTAKDALWWRGLLSKNRKINISIIIGLQMFKAVSPAMRAQCRHLFVLSCENDPRSLWEISGSFLPFNEFLPIVKQISRTPWSCIWFNKQYIKNKDMTLFMRTQPKKFKLIFTKPCLPNKTIEQGHQAENPDKSTQSPEDSDEDEQ